MIHTEPWDGKKGPVVGSGLPRDLRFFLSFLPTGSGSMKAIPQVALGSPMDSHILQEESP